MKILAIDTSGPVCGVAVMVDGTVRCEYSTSNRLTHSANLLPMIDAALSAAGINAGELDRLACVTGPGSFTGVRIGVSTMKGLAHGLQKPCIAVNALEAMASGIAEYNGIVCPIQDARAGQVYAAAFHVHDGALERIMDDTPVALDLLMDRLLQMNEDCLFLGDGMIVHREEIKARMGNSAHFSPAHLSFLRPASVAVIAESSQYEMDYHELEPYYLRAPNAERCKKLVEAAEHE